MILPPFKDFYAERTGHAYPKHGEQHPGWPSKDWPEEIMDTMAEYLDLLRDQICDPTSAEPKR